MSDMWGNPYNDDKSYLEQREEEDGRPPSHMPRRCCDKFAAHIMSGVTLKYKWKDSHHFTPGDGIYLVDSNELIEYCPFCGRYIKMKKVT